MAINPIQAPAPGRDPSTIGPRMPRLGLDPLLTLAVIGLGVASLVTLDGISHAQMARQGVYLGAGLVVMVVMSRFDYSRLRELKWGIYVILIFAILYIAGVDWRHLTAIFVLGLVALAVVLIVGPLVGFHSYQADRLTAFLDPGSVPVKQISGELYQQQQSVIAIGAGQKFGLGTVATNTAANFVPLNSTDFIFAALAERFGFAGAAFVLSLYALIIWRTLRIVAAAKNLFGALVAAGVVAMLMFQVFVNVGVTVDILPVTGVTLPLLSYGGSSVLTTFLALGLLQSIYAQARIAAGTKGRVLSI